MKFIRNLVYFNDDHCIFRRANFNLSDLTYLVVFKKVDFKQLQHLDLTNSVLGESGMLFLLTHLDATNKNMHSIYLENCQLGKLAVEKLNTIVERSLMPLKALNIGNNNLDDGTMFEVLISVSKNVTLRTLKIFGNKLDKKSFTTIGTILKIDRKLKLLDISKTGLNDKFASVISRGLINNHHSVL